MKKVSMPEFVLKKRTIIIEIISALFILLFVYTALSKFSEFGTFTFVLKESPLIGSWNEVVAWILPSMELIIATLLFLRKTRLLGMYCSFGIMVAFTLYLAYMIVFTPDRPCNCGGVLKQITWNQHLIFNIFFTFLGAIGLSLMKKKKVSSHEGSQAVVFT